MTTVKTIDVRDLPPRDRHPLIFSTFDMLQLDEALELITDHPPTPLYYQFGHERAGQFVWDVLEKGPHVWRACITKVQVE